jgi:protein O-GlcNAc transferase
MTNVANSASSSGLNSPSNPASNPALMLEDGLNFHRAGDYGSAMQVYQTILSLNPNHADALHLMGEASYRLGRQEQALAYLNHAIASAPHHIYLNTRGMVFLEQGHVMQAEQDLKRVIKIAPNYLEAYINLSNVYRKKRDFKNAKKFSSFALTLNPTSAAVWNTVGATHMEALELDAAIEAFNKALALEPKALAATKNIAMIYVAQKKWQEALPLLVSAAGLHDFEVFTTLSRAHMVLGQAEQAIEPFKEAMQLGSLENRKAFYTTSESVEQLLAVCNALSAYRSNYSDAAVLYQQAIEALPEHPTLINNLAVMQFNQAIYPKAVENLQKLLLLEPGNVLARANLGANLSIQGLADEAIVEFEKVLEYDPNHAPSLGLLISEKNKISNWKDLPALRAKMAEILDAPGNVQSVNSFTLLSNYDEPTQFLNWTRVNALENFANLGIKNAPASGVGREHARIRVGYYSVDFRNHPVAHLTAPLFELHDKSKFEVWIYSYGEDDGHPVRQRIKNSVEHFVDLAGCTLQGMVERIRGDEIDILIDLSGNTRGAKMQLMGHRPAPVQVHWLGFIGSMGSTHYDYTIVDHFVAPAGADQYYDEKLLRMPDCFQINDTSRQPTPIVLTREQCHLPSEGFIFADFNQSFKLQPEIFNTWVTIIKAVPGSVLWLSEGHPAYIRNIKETWAKAGLAAERLIFAPRVGVNEYLSQYQLVDLFLDAFPYTSGTTASDCLWAGCPLLTLVGKTMVARMGGSNVKAAGLPELITYSPEEYIKRAVYYAEHPAELALLRKRLADNRLQLPLFDTPKFVKHLETAFETMAKQSWAGEELTAISL